MGAYLRASSAISMSELRLSIIIVNWNGIAFLPACIRSIVENGPHFPCEVIVVDNDSLDGSAEWLESDECKHLMQDVPFTLIRAGANLGFGPANNLAIKTASAANILILNPDTLVTEGALDKLVKTLESEPRIGMVGPKILNEDGSLQHSVVRQPETPATIIFEELRIYKLLPRRMIATWLLGSHWNHDQRRTVRVVGGAAIMCKREMINEIGGFDPSIHMYAEEFEWCVRVRRGNWDIVFEPEAQIIHLRGRSTTQRWAEDERMIVQERALIYYENKSFSKLLNLSNCITKAVVLTLHTLRWRWHGKDVRTLQQLRNMRLENCRQLIFGPRNDIINTSEVN